MKRFLILWMLICLLTSVACLPAGAESDAEAGDYANIAVGTLTKPSGAFFTDMWGSNSSDMDVRKMIHGYSTMVLSSQVSFTPDPYVVLDTYFTADPNGNKLYVIELMDGLTYNDGSPIAARDYAFALLLEAAPQIKAIGGLTTGVSYIEGYDAFASGDTDRFFGVRLLGDLTLGIEIKAERLPFFFESSMLDVTPCPISVIAPGCEVADDGDGVYVRNADQDEAEPIFTAELLRRTILDEEEGYLSHPHLTSGPYTLTDYDREAGEVRFEINPYYAGNQHGRKPTIERVSLVTVTVDSMIDDLESERVQILNKVVGAEAVQAGQALVSSGSAGQVSYPRMGLGFVNFSCEQGPAQFEAVRQAIAYATDTGAYCTRYTGITGLPVYGYYGLGQWMVRVIGGEGADMLGGASTDDGDAWAALTLDALNPYDVDLDTARELLEADGWTLNQEGAPFREGSDAIRHKDVDGQLMPLSLRLARAEDPAADGLFEELMVQPLSELGASVEIVQIPFEALMRQYYRQDERAYDMLVLATNFTQIFDPYMEYNAVDAYQGISNTTGLRDGQLEQLADALRATEPGNALEYCQKWLAFQSRWNEVLPMLPLYSNLYFDFHSPSLYLYRPDAEMGWPDALMGTYYGSLPELEEPADEGEGDSFEGSEGEDDFEILDD